MTTVWFVESILSQTVGQKIFQLIRLVSKEKLLKKNNVMRGKARVLLMILNMFPVNMKHQINNLMRIILSA